MRTNFGRPAAVARMSGIGEGRNISGTVSFYCRRGGTLVVADICGLPTSSEPCKQRVFGFHIHEGADCAGEGYSDAGGHFNPSGCGHPMHAGDLPTLFENSGRAYMAVLTDRISPSEVVGRTVIIHDMPDDFRTQPSGDSGKRIACGVIRRT